MGIQVGIFPMKKSQKILCSVSHTWQGHSECSLLKADTQAVSQLASSLQSRIHLPRVLLVLFKQASKLSSFESSLNTNWLQLLMFPTYIAEANWVVASLAAINAISMTWTSWINQINRILFNSASSKMYLQSPQVPQARLHSTRQSVELQADTHCRYSSSHFDMHTKLKS